MSIKYQILGKPGRDNALMVWINGGTQIYRLLFDCGENLLHEVRQSDVKAVDYLFLSHLHIDHIAGFDYFFRRNYDRESKPVFIWGPDDTSSIIHHRLQGFKWNLAAGQPGTCVITDISENKLLSSYYKTSEGFSVKHNGSEANFTGVILRTEDFIVTAAILNHMIPVVAYSVIENDSLNIDKAALADTGLTPGAWLEKIKDLSVNEDEFIETDNAYYQIKHLREKLLVRTPGEKIAYLTDFVYDEKSTSRAAEIAQGCSTVVCECQYSQKDSELAGKNFHLTAIQTASIAKQANAKKLILFHISERYTPEFDYKELLAEARSVFRETYFPQEWNRFIEK